MWQVHGYDPAKSQVIPVLEEHNQVKHIVIMFFTTQSNNHYIHHSRVHNPKLVDCINAFELLFWLLCCWNCFTTTVYSLCQWANHSDLCQLAVAPTSEYDAVATIRLWHGCWFSGSVSSFAVCGVWFDFWGLTCIYFKWEDLLVVEWW